MGRNEELEKLIEQQEKLEEMKLRRERYFDVDDADKNRERLDHAPTGGKGNVYTRGKAHQLAGEDGGKIVNTIDTVIDVAPVLAAFAGGKIGKKLAENKSEGYKAAKLREVADNTDYKYLNADVLDRAEGTVKNPTGLLSSSVYDFWGKDIEDRFKKKLLKSAEKYGVDAKEINKVLHQIESGDYAYGSNKFADEIMDFIADEIPARAKTKKYIKMEDTGTLGVKKVVVPESDNYMKHMPNAIQHMGFASGLVGGIGAAENLAAKAKRNEQGLRGAGMPGVSELLDATGVTYNRTELVNVLKDTYDYIIKNGTYNQRQRAREIMKEVDPKKKKELIENVKAMGLIKTDVTRS